MSLQNSRCWKLWGKAYPSVCSLVAPPYLKELQWLLNGPVSPRARGRAVTLDLLMLLVTHIRMTPGGKKQDDIHTSTHSHCHTLWKAIDSRICDVPLFLYIQCTYTQCICIMHISWATSEWFLVEEHFLKHKLQTFAEVLTNNLHTAWRMTCG